MPDLDKDKLIAAVYSATLSPDNFDESLEKIDQLIFDQDTPARKINGVEQLVPSLKFDDANKHLVDPGLLEHIQLAHNIQLRLGRRKSEKHRILLLLDAAPNPAYIFDMNEQVIAANGHAKKEGQTENAMLKDICGSTDVLNNVRKFVSNGAEQKLLIVPGKINITQKTNSCILVKIIDEKLVDEFQKHDNEKFTNEKVGRKNEKLFFLTIVNLGFDDSKTQLFQKTYGLTPAEVDIAVHLASGKQISEIATQRGATIITIRTQIKTIKKKTNSRDIPAVVRLLCGFSAGILISSQLSPTDVSVNDEITPQKSFEQMTLRDGRRMSYLEQGNPTGKPVIMIHNMPYGVELPQKAIEAANRMNLRILAPYRPGFGNSDPNPNATGDKLLDEVAADIYELMDRLGITTAAIVGHSIGSVFALRFAKLYPNRVAGLFAVSRSPIWRDEWIAMTPKRQRFSLRITKYVPQLLPLIMHATAMFIDKGNGKKLVHILCEESPADIEALKNNPEICDLMVKGCEEGLKQGVDAFCGDCFLAIRDFCEEARSIPHSFHILHGDADQIVDLSQSRAFAESVPGTKLEIVQGAGQLLFYSHWDRVLKAIKNKI